MSMIYASIDTKTKDGRALAAYLENLAIVQVYKEPNERTLKSMKAAKSGRTKEVKNVKSWFEKLIS
ncbi:MAG: hypothetical protein IPM95_07080 [Sphingobacteriales bacterium]|jgi:hypothetical protein|nr:hypothetical protein [Sphingobacteriales bacterium]